MFRHTARYYDRIYSFKDYEREAVLVHLIIQARKRSPGNRLLDVACGTGAHAGPLSRYYHVEGLDGDPEMLAIARRKLPQLPFHQADMVDFDLGRRFEAVVCLFSSIGYAVTVERLRAAVGCMAAHLEPGGVLLVEPWITPDRYEPGGLHAVLVDDPDLKIARINLSPPIRDGRSRFEFHYLIGTSQGVEHLTETHEIGAFSHEAYLDGLGAAGLEVRHDPVGLMGRGLYVGTKPLAGAGGGA